VRERGFAGGHGRKATLHSQRIATGKHQNVPGGVGHVEGVGERGPLGAIERLRARGVGEVRKGGSEVLEQLFIRLLRVGPAQGGQLWVPQLGREVGATRQPGRGSGSGAAGGRTGCETSLSSSAVMRWVSRSMERGVVWGRRGSSGVLMERERCHTARSRSSHRYAGPHAQRGQASFIRLAGRPAASSAASSVQRPAPGRPALTGLARGPGRCVLRARAGCDEGSLPSAQKRRTNRQAWPRALRAACCRCRRARRRSPALPLSRSACRGDRVHSHGPTSSRVRRRRRWTRAAARR